MASRSTNSTVVEFFNNSHILVTGSTGFMGKVLVEKLLRVCRGISHLYLVIRVKKGKEPAVRLKELFEDPIFGELKKEYPDFLQKLSVVPGDCSAPGLGLSIEDKKQLVENLTHVFHGAANVRFDEKLRHAITVNVQGVKEMLKFCHTCHKLKVTSLKSVVHISTAYANCPLQSINEQFYSPPMPGESALKLIECLDDDKLELITPEIIKPWPNTYSFTKAIAEDIIRTEAKGLPIGVFRPSIVIGTASEPVSGWVDNLYGPTGVVVGVGAGLMRALHADGDIRADLVPVDMAVSALICSARDVAVKYGTELSNFPTIKEIWYHTITLTKYWPLYQVQKVLYHLIPAIIMDAVLLLSGNKRQMWKAYAKIHKFSTVISFFSTKEWIFGEDNTRQLWDSLSETDKKLFPFDMRSISWNKVINDTADGIRLYLFQDQPSTVPAARRKNFMLYLAHRALQLVLFIFLARGLRKVLSPIFPTTLYNLMRWTTWSIGNLARALPRTLI